MIFCRILGPVEITVDGAVAPAELLWRKNLALLVYLARSPKRAHTREHLMGLLWADKPEAAARHSLNESLRVIRRYTGDGGVETRGSQVRLDAAAVQLDTERFEALVAAQDWRGACTLIAGELLEGFGVPGASEFENWLAAERAAWRARSVDALIRHGEALLGAGLAQDAADAARRALALDPTSEPAVRAGMRSLALAGDRAGALAQFDAFAARLATEVGAAPDAETVALAERVRRERVWRRPPRGAPGGEWVVESRRTPLVGRGPELERLYAVWEACRLGPRAAVGLVAGDPGTGRTRLAEELLARARLDGAAVAAVRAVEADLDDPWSGIVGLARGGLLQAPGLAAAPPPALAAFAARLPEWAERFAAAVRSASPPLEQPGHAFSEVLRAVIGEQPVALLVDDANWLDRDSLLALAACARDLARAPVFLLFTLSPSPVRAELDELRSRIGRDLVGAGVELAPLPADALRALARWALPRYDETEIDRLTRRVSTDSAGLPLLAVELLHAVAHGLDLDGARGAWPEPFKTLDQSLPGDLPEAVVGAIRVGFRRLSAGAQHVLAAAAVLGGRVTPPVLERATGGGLGAEDLAAALDELEWQRWLAAEPRGYAFVARIVREVVARDMVTAGQRQRILEAAGTLP